MRIDQNMGFGLPTGAGYIAAGKQPDRLGKRDPAGESLGNLVRAELAGVNQNIRDAGMKVSAIQTADSILSALENLIQNANRMADEGVVIGLSHSDHLAIQMEAKDLTGQLGMLADNGSFNGTTLFGAAGIVASGLEKMIENDENLLPSTTKAQMDQMLERTKAARREVAAETSAMDSLLAQMQAFSEGLQQIGEGKFLSDPMALLEIIQARMESFFVDPESVYQGPSQEAVAELLKSD